MILLENKNIDTVFKETTDTDYDDLLSDRHIKYSNGNESKYTIKEYYKFEKGIEGNVEYMTANEYLDKCSKCVFNGRNAYAGVQDGKVNKYANAMLNGEKFPMPYIRYEYDGGQQEGRHRMLAADRAYPNSSFPVLVIKDSEYTKEERNEYYKKKYGNDYQLFIED